MRILKFGGTSVATPENVRCVIRIVRQALDAGPVAVVVSAFGGVTNELLAAAQGAAQREDSYLERWLALAERHRAAARELAGGEAGALAAQLEQGLTDLRDLLRGAFLLRECSPRTRDSILAYGERLSAEVVAAAMRADGLEATACDARRLIVTDDTFGRAQVDLEASYARIRDALRDVRGVAVVTGFIGATRDGETTTLGRGGSDYTAALLGAAVAADAIELWTDVDGVMSADPRVVAEAFPQPFLSYAELMELSHFGAKVVYPPTIHPARSQGIPLLIKNTLNPPAPGTRVVEQAPASELPIRGISSINRLVLMRLEGDGMVGVPGIAMRLFGALARQEVSVILISQSSSEHSICFAVAPDDAPRARDAVAREFALELRAGIVDELVVEDDQSVIAAVGEEMRERPGISGRLFSILGAHGVNVRAIAQGSSELNVSLVVAREDEATALNAIHGAFFAPRRRRLAIALAGPGRVGATLLEQLRQAAPDLLRDEDLEVRLVALVSRRNMLLDRAGIDLGDWRARLAQAPPPEPLRLIDFLRRRTGELRVFVDCTADPDVTGWYPELLAEQVAVVAANKLAFAGPSAFYRTLHAAARRGRGPLLFEATVGAGLPVLSTLTSLQRTGHAIARIDGVLSGTVNAVLDRLAGGTPFSAAVQDAHAAGLTEPNPYEDLSGGDVARKLCILARLAGRALEAREIAVTPLLPAEPWSRLSLGELWRDLPQLDADFARRQAEAAAAGGTLRYLATLDGEGARVELRTVTPDHPAFHLDGPNNLIAFTTQHYCDAPLVVRGPGAGPAVTASGVFADVLHAAAQLDRDRS